MSFGYQYIFLLLLGLGGMVWGVPAAHRLRPPIDVAAAVAVLCGVVLFALGVLLLFIPHFFR